MQDGKGTPHRFNLIKLADTAENRDLKKRLKIKAVTAGMDLDDYMVQVLRQHLEEKGD